ncbi:hypothetical protein EDEG_00381 [Edhazardia aedis USNM 41457]|uniref:HTH La-type RNA-binding domain-containing protein n=1 Tax=Edhazardia aedis (strain USNM 41457) TaxID=1003232 RepID=J9DGQ1_EDHAE|nr:hypothetical protein EDEG_00381 [Edhazardia aedis USNM 41457]|eukprot:EJW01790.1 hypothetical protein EDEG_00381 [Edhazardia aedis USNM 41457]
MNSYEKIKEALSYYFSDANFRTDSFLQIKSKENDGWIDGDIFLEFNKLKENGCTRELLKKISDELPTIETRELLSNSQVTSNSSNFLNKSSNEDSIVKSNSNAMVETENNTNTHLEDEIVPTINKTDKIYLRKRITPEYENYLNNTNFDAQTLFISRFDTSLNVDEIKSYLKSFFDFTMIRLKRNKDKTSSGSVVVEVSSPEEAKRISRMKIVKPAACLTTKQTTNVKLGHQITDDIYKSETLLSSENFSKENEHEKNGLFESKSKKIKITESCKKIDQNILECNSKENKNENSLNLDKEKLPLVNEFEEKVETNELKEPNKYIEVENREDKDCEVADKKVQCDVDPKKILDTQRDIVSNTSNNYLTICIKSSVIENRNTRKGAIQRKNVLSKYGNCVYKFVSNLNDHKKIREIADKAAFVDIENKVLRYRKPIGFSHKKYEDGDNFVEITLMDEDSTVEYANNIKGQIIQKKSGYRKK